MTQVKEVKEVKIVKAEKAGDWVLPITVDGATVYALQINKSAEDKQNIDTILQEYADKGVTVYTYKGKNDADVLLVDASKKIRNKRVGVKTQKLLNALLATGMTQAQAEAVISASK